MHEANTRLLNFVGTPAGWRRVGFTDQDGVVQVAMVKMASDWDVEVHIEESNRTCYCVGVSANKAQVVAERWLVGHAPRRLEYANPSEQQAAMGGQDATTLDYAGIVTALQNVLTDGDSPPPIPVRVLNLTPVDDSHTVEAVGEGLEQRGDLCFADRGGSQVWWFDLCGRRQAMRTMSSITDTRHIYRNGAREMFFLFDLGATWLLEHVRPWEGTFQRRHVQLAKASVVATEPAAVVTELDPQLVYDPDSFA